MDTRYELNRVPPRGKSNTYPLRPYVEIVKVATAKSARQTSWNLMTAREIDEFFDRVTILPNTLRQEAKHLLEA